MASDTQFRPAGHRPWQYAARQWAWAAVDLVFPPACAGCGKEGQRFCVDCRSALDRLEPPVCQHCGYPVSVGPSSLCPACLRQPWPGLAGIRSAAFFAGPLQHALHRLKYRRDIALADALAEVLCAAWRAYGLPVGLVASVPLSARRQAERGYNQAGLLARGFADLAGLDYNPHALARARHTVSQVGLSAAARRANVADAFQASPAWARGRTILLVDDVCTTGATLSACGAALRAAGALGVWGLTVARARALTPRSASLSVRSFIP